LAAKVKKKRRLKETRVTRKRESKGSDGHEKATVIDEKRLEGRNGFGFGNTLRAPLW
jgi:hypothetical protein